MLRFLLSFYIICSALAVAMLWHFHSSLHDSQPTACGGLTAVVFTGQYNRIPPAIAGLRSGCYKHVLISGINPGAGLSVATLAAQFGISDAEWQHWYGRSLFLGEQAEYTLQNPGEVRQLWRVAMQVEKTGFSAVTEPGASSTPADPERLVLITSQSHMPRAVLALKAEFPFTRIDRVTVPDEKPGFAIYEREFVKYLGTWGFVLWKWAYRLVPAGVAEWSGLSASCVNPDRALSDGACQRWATRVD